MLGIQAARQTAIGKFMCPTEREREEILSDVIDVVEGYTHSYLAEADVWQCIFRELATNASEKDLKAAIVSGLVAAYDKDHFNFKLDSDSKVRDIFAQVLDGQKNAVTLLNSVSSH